MDNPSRSERTRTAVIEAALTIISRDGAGRLTLDAIAHECGFSKGALTHQFRTKKAVLEVLLQHQIDFFERFSRAYLAEHGSEHVAPELAAQIATLREALSEPRSIVFAILGAMAQEPALLSMARGPDAAKLKAIKAEADDPELATLRWAAARGLTLSTMFGLCPLSKAERDRLFERLLDETRWSKRSRSSKRVVRRRTRVAGKPRPKLPR